MPSTAGEFVTETFDYDGGRQVTVHVPPHQPKPVVFAGDGQVIPQWGADLEAADLPSTLIVGVHRSNETSADGPHRVSGRRYLPHEQRCSESRRAASWRSPWDFGIHFVAGTQEPYFHENATRWAAAFRTAGADVVMTERAGSHGDAFCRQEFPRMVTWAFER